MSTTHDAAESQNENAINLIRIEDARAQSRDYVLAFLPDPEEVEEGHDCETCRVIKAIAAGFGPPEE